VKAWRSAASRPFIIAIFSSFHPPSEESAKSAARCEMCVGQIARQSRIFSISASTRAEAVMEPTR
jgi:hypothetical protein